MRRYGRAYLEAIRNARAAPRIAVPRRPSWAEVVARAAELDADPTATIVRSAVAAAAHAAPQVSVVMPAYNHERFVCAALDSIVAQTLADTEIIAIDDGSRDATGTLLDGDG